MSVKQEKPLVPYPTVDISTLNAAAALMGSALGSAHVRTQPPVIEQYGRTSGGTAIFPAAVVFPASTAEVRQVVEIAAKFRIGLYPISRGCNWGYGDAAAARPGQVIVDLRRMNRVIEINRDLAYAVIEPGVTQQQLHEALEGTGLWMDATGAGLNASIVGNTLDRGFGHSRYGARTDSVGNFEVVLGDGRVITTGYGSLPNARAAHVYPEGVGPSLDGLFVQSSFGIVTRMTVWLMPEPEAFAGFFISTEDDEAIGDLVERLGRLRRAGMLQSNVHIGNDLRLLAARMQYPWDRAGGVTPLPPELRRELRREQGLGAWAAAGAIYGTRKSIAAVREALRHALPRDRYEFAVVDDRRLRSAKAFSHVLPRFGFGRRLAQQIDTVQTAIDLLRGKPTDHPLYGTAWRVRDRVAPEVHDPLEIHAGLMWIAPVLPQTAADCRELLALMQPVFDQHGFDMPVTFTMINERALICISNISFDQREPEDRQRAAECYQQLMTKLTERGCYPYRTPPAPQGLAHLMTPGDPAIWDIQREIKGVFDPHGILSRGRYEPPPPEPPPPV